MWPSWKAESIRLDGAIVHHSKNKQGLLGARNAVNRAVLVEQFVASMRREKYYSVLQKKTVGSERADPQHPMFHPERAVAYYIQQGQVDEAAWLVFLMTHFARPSDSGWLRLQDVYGQLGAGKWDWATVVANPSAFTAWLDKNWTKIRGKFGNHRKYESLRPTSKRPMVVVVESYLNWIGGAGHRPFFAAHIKAAGNDPHRIFDRFYHDCSVLSFGRLAKFDYLSMLGRFNVAPIEAGIAYLDGATGPARGARLLFANDVDADISNNDLQALLDDFDKSISVGMTVMEDALCNWQKSPELFVHFKG